MLLAASVLGACGTSWTAGRGVQVIEAHVVAVHETGVREIPNVASQPYQVVEIELDGSLYRGDRVRVEWGGRRALNYNGLLSPGDQVLVTAQRADDGSRQYAIIEIVRIPALAPFAAIVLVVLLLVARWKGLAAIAGLGGSIAVFLLAVIPAVQRGDDPLLATLIGSLAVLVASVFVVHGLNRKSIAALVGAAGGLMVVGALAAAGLSLARITGLGSEEEIFLAIGSGGRIDMPRLVLAGMIIGSLGALVDMSVGQASTVFELSRAEWTLRGRALYASALNVGRDHIGSLINTLALAYFGGTLPLLVLLSLGDLPLALALNSEEIISSVLVILVASAGLVLCVPLTTAVAVWLVPPGERRS